jgi:hypothetical protein
MTRSRDIPWNEIKAEYRLGQLSMAEIARRHNISHVAIIYRRKKEGWEKDLKNQATKAIEKKLPINLQQPMCAKDDASLVEMAADRALQVVICHRKDAEKHRKLINDITGHLESLMSNNGIVDLEDARDASQAIKNLAGAAKSTVYIERQAYGIPDVRDEAPGAKEIKVNIISFGEINVGEG